MVRKYPAHEVFLLMKRLRNHNAKEEKATTNNGVIRKKAGNDWY